ncbi:MAG: hypothetical protein ACE366_16435 [Bradymonadia bacterium]
MRTLKLFLLCCLPLCFGAQALAQSPPLPDVVPGAAVVTAEESTATPAPWDEAAPVPEAGQILKSGSDALAAVKLAVADPSVVTISGALAAVLFVVIGALRRWGPLVGWLTGQRIRLLTLIIGIVAAIAMGLSSETTWLDALIAGVFTGPGALLLHQYLPKLAIRPAPS